MDNNIIWGEESVVWTSFVFELCLLYVIVVIGYLLYCLYVWLVGRWTPCCRIFIMRALLRGMYEILCMLDNKCENSVITEPVRSPWAATQGLAPQRALRCSTVTCSFSSCTNDVLFPPISFFLSPRITLNSSGGSTGRTTSLR